MKFSYIITIHNKDFILDKVLDGVERNAGKDAVIIPVLDGCTDKSEEIVKRYAAKSDKEYRITYAENVHEIRSINAGLKNAPPGFCIILQDDVVLAANDLESTTLKVWNKHKQKIGYLTYRMGCRVGVGKLFERLKFAVKSGGKHTGPFLGEFDHVSGPIDHFDGAKRKLAYYQDEIVDAGIKSPVCLTPALRLVSPFLDENLAPYCYDDFDLSLVSLKAGLINILMPFPVVSELEWGGTRKDSNFSRNAWRIMTRNREYLMTKHRQILRKP